jgi:hypothetical protein
LSELQRSCDRLGDYPLSKPLSLAGGYGDRSGRRTQTHLSLRIAPWDHKGALLVKVALADPNEHHDPWAERRRNVRTSFVVGYNDLGRFQSALRRLLSGHSNQALLKPSQDFR